MIKTAVVLPFLALALAACGNNASNQSSSPTSAAGSPKTSPAASGAAVHVASTKLGKVLVDSKGHTVYLLTADSPGHSTCNPSCQAYWPPVKASGSVPKSVPGVMGAVSTASLPGGGKVVTVGGWPLYTFVKDTEAGDTYGQGIANFGGTWYAVSPEGKAIKAPAPKESSSGSGSGGY